MPRVTNKTNGASQPRNTQASQRRSSQAQNGRASSQNDDGSGMDEPGGEEGEEDAEERDDDGTNVIFHYFSLTKELILTIMKELTRRANALVRLALFNEYRRMPLKREEISKKGLFHNNFI